MILNNDKDSVGSMSLTFSKCHVWNTAIVSCELLTSFAGTYDIQHCDVTSDHTSILVECTFAINSTAPGFVLLQDEQSQYVINRILRRLGGDLSGFVNISGLPAGEYNVTVFDQEEDYMKNNPAFQHAEYLTIHARIDHQSSSSVLFPTNTAPGLYT